MRFGSSVPLRRSLALWVPQILRDLIAKGRVQPSTVQVSISYLGPVLAKSASALCAASSDCTELSCDLRERTASNAATL